MARWLGKVSKSNIVPWPDKLACWSQLEHDQIDDVSVYAYRQSQSVVATLTRWFPGPTTKLPICHRSVKNGNESIPVDS